MELPNKIFVIEYKGENGFLGQCYFNIVVAASSKELAKMYVKSKIGVDGEPVLLMGATYQTIYVRDGSKPEPIQAKILFNGNVHFD